MERGRRSEGGRSEGNSCDGEPGPAGGDSVPAEERVRAVLRMLGGEEESRLSVELGVPAHRLEEWRRLFVGAGERELRRAEGEPSDPALFRAWAKIGQLTLLLDAWKDLLARSGHDSGNR